MKNPLNLRNKLSTLIFLAVSASTASTLAVANELSPANPVLRSLILMEGEVLTGASVIYGDLENGENEWQGGIYAAYGITESITIDTIGAHYRFMDRARENQGLEMAASIGLVGELKSNVNGDALGINADVTGKYIFNEDMALLFGVSYIHWDEDNLDDKSEFDYSIGIQKNLIPNFTLSANYTYRDLNDFAQSSAYAYSVGLNYNINRNLDVGMVYGKTDFEFENNGYNNDDSLTDGYGIYASYRF